MAESVAVQYSASPGSQERRQHRQQRCDDRQDTLHCRRSRLQPARRRPERHHRRVEVERPDLVREDHRDQQDKRLGEGHGLLAVHGEAARHHARPRPDRLDVHARSVPGRQLSRPETTPSDGIETFLRLMDPTPRQGRSRAPPARARCDCPTETARTGRWNGTRNPNPWPTSSMNGQVLRVRRSGGIRTGPEEPPDWARPPRYYRARLARGGGWHSQPTTTSSRIPVTTRCWTIESRVLDARPAPRLRRRRAAARTTHSRSRRRSDELNDNGRGSVQDVIVFLVRRRGEHHAARRARGPLDAASW